jgi:hypothetical protein
MNIITVIFFLLINGQTDCQFFCKRGSCNPSVTGFKLSCHSTVHCYNSLCEYYLGHNCLPDVPYFGSISKCNQTNCVAPFGCTLISFSQAQNSCQDRDNFCDNELENTCCNNDENCNKLFSPCILTHHK